MSGQILVHYLDPAGGNEGDGIRIEGGQFVVGPVASSGSVFAAEDLQYDAIDVTTYRAQSDAAMRLALASASHVGSDEATHPSVRRFPQGWNGWRYWMAFTPYISGSDATEDPCIAVSQDGIAWQVPAGLTNPLDDAPGGTKYNSDTELAMSPDGTTLSLVWRQRDDAATGAEETLYLRTSTDGVTWSAKQAIVTANKATEILASPAILHDGTQWVMWTVDIAAAPNVIKRRTAASLAGPWSAPTACTATGLPSGRDLWHIFVLRLGGQYVALLNDAQLGTGGIGGRLYLMRSTDQTSWEIGDEILSPALAANYDSLYRGALVPMFDNGRLEFDMFHGGWQSGTFTNRIYRHRLTQTPAAAASGLTVQDESGTVATDVTQLDFQGANVVATPGTGEVVVTVTGATSSSTRWEVVMAPGTSSPPVPLETPDGTDWLYAEV